jgi:rubredoxin
MEDMRLIVDFFRSRNFPDTEVGRAARGLSGYVSRVRNSNSLENVLRSMFPAWLGFQKAESVESRTPEQRAWDSAILAVSEFVRRRQGHDETLALEIHNLLSTKLPCEDLAAQVVNFLGAPMKAMSPEAEKMARDGTCPNCGVPLYLLLETDGMKSQQCRLCDHIWIISTPPAEEESNV